MTKILLTLIRLGWEFGMSRAGEWSAPELATLLDVIRAMEKKETCIGAYFVHLSRVGKTLWKRGVA